MKVLHIAPSSARREGGPSEVLRGLLPALRAEGISTKLITTDKGMNESDDDLRSDPRVMIFPCRRLQSWSFAPSAVRAIQREVADADVVHIHSIHTFTTTVGLRAAVRRSTPALLQPHGALDHYHLDQGRLKKTLYSRIFDRTGLDWLKGSIYSSTHERDDAAASLPESPAYLVPLGVDESLFSVQRKPRESHPTILFMGRVTRKKRLDLLLEAFALYTRNAPQSRLIVAGPIDPRLDYSPERIAEALGIRGQVDFLGQVDAQRRRQLLSEASLFCLPSEDESFGVAPAEALAAGCPVLVSNQVGISGEVSQAGGLATTSLDVMRLVEKIRSILTDEKTTEAMAAAGRRYAKSHYTWQQSARSTIHAYNRAVIGPNRREQH